MVENNQWSDKNISIQSFLCRFSHYSDRYWAEPV